MWFYGRILRTPYNINVLKVAKTQSQCTTNIWKRHLSSFHQIMKTEKLEYIYQEEHIVTAGKIYIKVTGKQCKKIFNCLSSKHEKMSANKHAFCQRLWDAEKYDHPCKSTQNLLTVTDQPTSKYITVYCKWYMIKKNSNSENMKSKLIYKFIYTTVY